jgi:hypothetical protein
MSIARACLVGVVLLASLPAPAAAQPTRAGEIAEAQAAKAANPPVDPPGRIERTVVALRRAAVESPSGPYPIADSVYNGGGAALGVGYRQYVGDRTFLTFRGLYSVKHYGSVEGLVTSRGHREGRLDLGATTSFVDATEVGYYGLGPHNDESDRANFRQRHTVVGGQATLRPRWPLVVGASLAGEVFDIDSGHGSEPSIEESYDASTAPGLGLSPGYAHSSLSGAIDWRPAAGYARRGGNYGATYHRFDRSGGYAFERLDLDIVQHLPLLRETYVLSGHARVQSALHDDAVPYFLLPALGGGSTLRAYSSFRYRDRHALLVQGEFRWVPNKLGLDMALFWDGGTVAPEFGKLALRGFAHDVGVGIRLHTPISTPIRVELAFGSDGPKVVFAGKAAF